MNGALAPPEQLLQRLSRHLLRRGVMRPPLLPRRQAAAECLERKRLHLEQEPACNVLCRPVLGEFGMAFEGKPLENGWGARRAREVEAYGA